MESSELHESSEKLQQIRDYCESILNKPQRARSDWGRGYEQAERDFAQGLLLLYFFKERKDAPSC